MIHVNIAPEPRATELKDVLIMIERSLNIMKPATQNKLDSALAICEACERTIKRRAHDQMGLYNPDQIRIMGRALRGLDEAITTASNQLIFEEDYEQTIEDLQTAVAIMKEVWRLL